MIMRRFFLVLALLPLASLAFGATLSGRVTDTTGAGVYRLDIDVYNAVTGLPVTVNGDSTTLTGDYTIVLASGTYRILFIPAAGSHRFTHEEPAYTIQVNKILNVVLPRGKYLIGTVLSAASGLGVRLVDIDFHDPVTGGAALNVEGDLTDSLGHYDALVDSATWDVSFKPPLTERLVPVRRAAIDLRADQNLGPIELAGGRLIQGTVTDIGFFPVADADLDVRPAGGGPKQFTPGDNTAADGSYAMVIPPGTYDVIAAPTGSEPLATATARAVSVSSDTAIPNLVLPPGMELKGNCVTSTGVGVTGVDLDVDSLPGHLRIEVLNDQSTTGGSFRVLVPAVDLRATFSPPVGTKLVPVRFDSLHITGLRDFGNVVFSTGAWVSGTVRRQGSNLPVQGANLDFVRLAGGALAVTPGDLTDASGFFRVVLPPGSYRLRVAPPDGTSDTLVVNPVNVTGSDTTLALTLPSLVTAVETTVRPRHVRLSPPWPNPSGGGVRMTLEADSPDAELTVWDVQGRRVAVLYRGAAFGIRSQEWNGTGRGGRRLPAGVYFIRLRAGLGSHVRRLVMLP